MLRLLKGEGLRARMAARRDSRQRRAQLPVVASVLAAYVRAGRSLRQAIADAAADVPEPSARSLREAAAAIAVGAPPGEALAALGGDPDVAHLRAVVEMQARTGGDLVLLLDGMADLLRSREEQRRAAAVATAQARATGRMVTAMPVFGIGSLWLLDRPGFRLVLSSPAGWAAMAVSVLLAVAGHVLIRRIAAVDP
ncbi:MAG TPA: type II secretion system F family protein [Gaiellales bacterium]|nr:type II secretion system F family protein [Gaiellales bacterium]